MALTVVKSGQAKDDINKVDGITGATLTSKGVAEMVTTGLQKYVDAFKVQTASSEVDENIPDVEDYQNIENIQKED